MGKFIHLRPCPPFPVTFLLSSLAFKCCKNLAIYNPGR
ncbi:hypothetical protein LEMLEM_LOCUS22556 [Lemmus lemmus]